MAPENNLLNSFQGSDLLGTPLNNIGNQISRDLSSIQLFITKLLQNQRAHLIQLKISIYLITKKLFHLTQPRMLLHLVKFQINLKGMNSNSETNTLENNSLFGNMNI